MRKSSRLRIKGVAIFIVFLAIAISLYEYQNRKKNDTASADFDKTSANEYRDLKFINKAKIGFSSDDVENAREGISQIMDKYSKQRIRKHDEGNYGAYLFTISQDKLYTVVDELRALGTVGPRVEQIDTALVNLDFENENAKLSSYEGELVELNKVRQPSSAQNDRKETLHSQIQASRSSLDKLRNKDNVLLYITLSPQQRSIGWLNTFKSFVKSFLIWLVILSIASVLIFYATKLLMIFLYSLGIRGPGGPSGTTYGGYSNYSRYSSRYGNSRRKIKRIYKDKGASPEENEPENKENK